MVILLKEDINTIFSTSPLLSPPSGNHQNIYKTQQFLKLCLDPIHGISAPDVLMEWEAYKITHKINENKLRELTYYFADNIQKFLDLRIKRTIEDSNRKQEALQQQERSQRNRSLVAVAIGGAATLGAILLGSKNS